MLPSAKTLRGALIAGLTLLPIGHAVAQEATPAHIAAAREAINALDATQQFDNILPNAATQIKAELIGNYPGLQNEISAMVDDEAVALAARRVDLENEVARLYARFFTEQELREIAAFYTTEAGEKLLAQGAPITREMMAAADVWANGIVRDLRANAVAGMSEVVPQAGGEAGVAAPTTGAAAEAAASN